MKNHDDDDLIVGKFFTRAMKIPLMVGRLIDGTRLWGGPYTVPQIVVGVVAGVRLVLLHRTHFH